MLTSLTYFTLAFEKSCFLQFSICTDLIQNFKITGFELQTVYCILRLPSVIVGAQNLKLSN